MKILFRILVLLPLFLFFLATAPGNRSDADSAFDHAHGVESGVEQLNPHYPLYIPLLRAAYLPLRRLGWVDRAHPLMTLFGAVSAAVTAYLFFLFCYHRFSLRPLSSLFAAGFFLFSHGVWRYAAEAEPMVPANMLALAAFLLVSRPDPARTDLVRGGLLAGLAIMMNSLALVPALVMIPLYLALTGGGKRTWPYLAGCVGTALAVRLLLQGLGYTVPRLTWQPYSAPVQTLAALFLRALVGMGQCTISGSALLRFEPMRVLLADLFPYRMLDEEFYQAQRISIRHGVAAIVTLALTAGLFLYGAIRAWRAARSPERRGRVVPGGRAALAGVLFWLLAHTLLTLGNQPGKPESWLMAMVPLWLLFCGLFVAPLARANKLWIVLALLSVFALHNWVGGLSVVQDPAGDYNYSKSAWVVAEAGPGDVIVTGDTQVFVRYLRYHTRARVVDLNAEGPGLVAELRAWPGRVFVLNDVFTPPAVLTVRFSERTAETRRLAQQLRPYLRQAARDEFGGVYVMEGGG